MSADKHGEHEVIHLSVTFYSINIMYIGTFLVG